MSFSKNEIAFQNNHFILYTDAVHLEIYLNKNHELPNDKETCHSVVET